MLLLALVGMLVVGVVGAVSLLAASDSDPQPDSEELATPLVGETGSEQPKIDSARESVESGMPRTAPEGEREALPQPRSSLETGDVTDPSGTTTEADTDTTGAPSRTSTETQATDAATAVTAEPPPNGITQVAYANDTALMIFEEPDQRVGWALPNPTQFGGPRVVTVLGTTPDKLWHRVSVPVQPNGTIGWVKAEAVRIEEHNFRARITLSSRRVEVWDGDQVVTDTGAVIGKSSTPTPLGTFFVRDIIPQSYSGGAYGPWIIALSGFSEVMDTFDGGLPAIAVHGTNRPDLIGSAASNGCIRIPNDIVTQLASQVPLGTQVEVLA